MGFDKTDPEFNQLLPYFGDWDYYWSGYITLPNTSGEIDFGGYKIIDSEIRAYAMGWGKINAYAIHVECEGLTNIPNDTLFSWLKSKYGQVVSGNVPVQIICSIIGAINFSGSLTAQVYINLAPPPAQGILMIDTSPVKGEVFVDGVSWGVAPQSRSLNPGTYTVSFGDLAGYTKPPPQTAVVTEGQTTTVIGEYTPISPGQGTLTVDTTPIKGEIFVNGASWGVAPQSRNLDPGVYTVSFGEMPGYTKPSAQTVTVTEGKTSSVLGTYVAITPPPPTTLALTFTLAPTIVGTVLTAIAMKRRD